MGTLVRPGKLHGMPGEPFERGCLDVNFERKGTAAGGRKGKGSDRTGILQDKWDCQALNEAIGEAKWEAGIRINGGIQGPGERNPR